MTPTMPEQYLFPGSGATVPEDARVLRIVASLSHHFVTDRTGGARLWHYSPAAIAEALAFLEHCTAAQARTALARAAWFNAELPDPQVLPLMRSGGAA